MSKPVKTYPPREFFNVPSYEESVDLWRKEYFRLLRTPTLVALSAALAICCWLVVTAPPLGRPAITYLVIAAISLVPAFAHFHARLMLPPRPTPESHEKVLSLMRLYHASNQTKEQDAATAARRT